MAALLTSAGDRVGPGATEANWDPLGLDHFLTDYVDDACARASLEDDGLDLARCSAVITDCRSLFAAAETDLVNDDSLPGLAHAFLALGDIPGPRSRLLGRIGDFVESGTRRIRQHHPEGDFHPWQCFAYLVLVAPNAGDWILTDGSTVRDVARGSQDLAVTQSEELGHPLLAGSRLFADSAMPPLRFDGQELGVEEIVRRALHAQWFGHFEVCRKFHLTGGLVSMTARDPDLARYRGLVAAALRGQYRVLEATAALTFGLADDPKDPHIALLRNELGLSDLFADHLFYAGHLLELSNIAAHVGAPTPSPRVLEPMINTVNAWVASHLRGHRNIRQNVVQVSHYLRGLCQYVARRSPVRAHDRGRALPEIVRIPFAPPPDAEELPRPAFTSTLDVIGRIAPHLTLRGSYPHFRRYRPDHWPRPLHYELLDYGNGLGAELHIESDDCSWARPLLIELARQLPVPAGAVRVEFDPDWWLERGRLRALFPENCEPVDVAQGFVELVRATEPTLDRAAQQQTAVIAGDASHV